jgi:hypothetical protein
MADVEKIITDDKDAFEEYQREQLEAEEAARAYPTPTEQYESPIGPERPTPTSFREKVETKARDIKEKVLSKVGDIKKNYERKRAKTERDVKSTPEYLTKKAEHDLYMEEMRARSSGGSGRAAPRRSSTKAMPSLITMGGYKSAYTGKSTAPSVSFGGGYKPAYTGQMPMGVPRPVTISNKPMSKPKPIKITSFGSGAMPKIGNFSGSSLLPKIGGGGKKMETPKIGFSFGATPKIGKSITHMGSVKSLGLKTNIGILGEIPKIGFGLKKKTVKRKVKRKGRKK